MLAYSYAVRSSLASPDDMLDRAVIVKGPYHLDVLNVTEDAGIWVNVECMVGVDAGSVIGVNRAQMDGIFSNIWKSLGRWGIRQLSSVTVKMSAVRISPENEYPTVLASLDMSPMNIPLTTEPPPNLSWLTKAALTIHISPTHNLTALMKFVRDTWRDGRAAVHVHVEQATVQGGSLYENSWRRNFEQRLSDIHKAIHINSKCPT